MATHCDDVSARMVDLLYGELSADERAEIDAHVAGCERCRSELDGFQKTRAVARQALDEAPPPHVRASILKAAAAHLAAQAQAQPAARAPVAPERVSFWDRLRVRWTFPTLATVGALAVFLVANRVFMNPERTMEKAQVAVQAPAPVAQPVPSAGAPAVDPRATSSAKAEADLPPRAVAEAGGRYDQTAQQGARSASHGNKRMLAAPADLPAGAPKHVASGSAPAYSGDPFKDSAGAPRGVQKQRLAPAKPRSISDDALDGLIDEAPSKKAASGADNEKRSRRAEPQFAPPPPPREAPVAKSRAPMMDKSMDKSASAPVMKAGKPAKGSLDDLLDSVPRESSRAGGGASGPGAVGGLAGRKNKSDDYGSGAAQPAPEVAAKEEEAPKRPAPKVAAAPAPAAASAPAASPPLAAPAPRAHGKSGAAYDDEDAPLARNADSKAAKKKSKAGATETLAQRADRLFSEGRWNEAAAAYRELLRRDPRNDDAERWRRRLVAAESADTSDRNASLAEKRAAEAKPARSAPPKAAKAASKKASDSALDAAQ